MPIVAQRCLGLSEKLYKYGPAREIEVCFKLCYMPQKPAYDMELVHLWSTDAFQNVFCHFVQVQDAMARITLDVIMATGFDLPSNAVDLDQACPLLEDMHFLMAETFR